VVVGALVVVVIVKGHGLEIGAARLSRKRKPS